MPESEHNRRIEGWLRAYARARQRPAELHPASRKLLQDEVKQTFGAAMPEKRRFIASLWVRWPAAAIFATCVVTLVISHRSEEENLAASLRVAQPMPLAATKTSAPPLAASPPRDGISPLPAPEGKAIPEVASRLDNATSSGAITDSKKLVSAPSTTAPAPQPTQPAASTLAASAPPKEPPQETTKELPLNNIQSAGSRGFQNSAGALPSANAPTGPPTFAAASPPPVASAAHTATPPESHAGSETNRGQRFVQTAGSSARLTDRGDQTAPLVLESFQLARNGDRVSIIDADGSVYDGAVELTASQMQALAPAGADAAPAQTSAQGYSFSVQGVNHRTQQLVSFTGVFVPSRTGGLAGRAGAGGRGGGGGGGGGGGFGGGGGGRRGGGRATQERVTGTVTVNGTNQFHLDANASP